MRLSVFQTSKVERCVHHTSNPSPRFRDQEIVMGKGDNSKKNDKKNKKVKKDAAKPATKSGDKNR